MSGGYEYNLTTQTQFQQMKQKYQDLLQQNFSLKKTLEQLIKVNNQLSDTIEQFNNSEWAHEQQSKLQKKQLNDGNNKGNHDQCHKLIEGLEHEVEYFKGLASGKLDGEDNVEVINALEGLIDSFKQAQKYYEDELTSFCEEIDNMKSQWEGKIFKIEEEYFEKTKVMQQMIKEMKKKQEIVSIIEKKIMDENKSNRKLLKKNSEIDTSSERKVGNNHNPRQVENSSKQKIDPGVNNKELQDLKAKEKKLNEQLKEKDKTIGVYTDLLAKLRKKLAQKL